MSGYFTTGPKHPHGYQVGDVLEVTSYVPRKWWEIWLLRLREMRWTVPGWRTVKEQRVVTEVVDRHCVGHD